MHQIVVNLNQRMLSSIICTCGYTFHTTDGRQLERSLWKHTKENPLSSVTRYTDNEKDINKKQVTPRKKSSIKI